MVEAPPALFDAMRVRPDRPGTAEAWIQRVIDCPEREEV
jgi:hypothetical protein